MQKRFSTIDTRERWTRPQPGMLVDMIVLEQNPLTIATSKITDMKVDLTMVGGRILYTRPGSNVLR